MVNLLSASALLHSGYVPAEDPHHCAVLRLHAGEALGLLPVALPTLPHGWGHSSAGISAILSSFTDTQVHCYVVCVCRISMQLMTPENQGDLITRVLTSTVAHRV